VGVSSRCSLFERFPWKNFVFMCYLTSILHVQLLSVSHCVNIVHSSHHFVPYVFLSTLISETCDLRYLSVRGSRCSSVSVVTRLLSGSPVFVSQQGFLFSPLLSDRLWDPPSFILSGCWDLSPPGVKGPAREADHLPPSSAQGKDASLWCGA
jgi:hypothetical protein